MKRAHFLSFALLLIGCVTNPYTGRDQLILIGRDSEIALGLQAYQEMLGQEQVTFDPNFLGPVQEVTNRLATTIEGGWGEIPPPQFTWDVRVIVKNEANAWCLPGGKMAVYTGIFPILQDQNGLAVVMGHELFHAVLRHGAERISQGMAAQIGVTVGTAVLGGDDPETKEAVYAALGLGAALGVLLPYSRKGETEADEFGLYLAAKAGYDPRAAIGVWERMRAAGAGGTPEFLSTHPDPGTRIENMQRWMPKALEYYEASPKHLARLLPGAQGSSITGGPRRVDPPAGVAAAGLTNRGAKRTTIEDSPGIEFEFAVREDSYLETIDIEGPEGLSKKIEVKSAARSNVPWNVRIWNRGEGSPPLPSGSYRLTFRGEATGAEFVETGTWQVE